MSQKKEKSSQNCMSLGQTLKRPYIFAPKSTPPEISGRWGIKKVEKQKENKDVSINNNVYGNVYAFDDFNSCYGSL